MFATSRPASSAPAPLGRVTGARLLTLLSVLALALGGILWLGGTPLARAEGKDDAAQRKAQVDQQIEDLRGQLTDVNQDLADTYLALARTELMIPDAQQALDQAQQEAQQARDDDAATGLRLTAAQQEQDRLEGDAEQGQQEVDRSDEQMMRVSLDAYKGEGMPSPASVFLESADPQSAVDRSMNYRLTLATQGTRLNALRTDQALTANSADRLSAVRQEVADLKAQSERTLQAKNDAEAQAQKAKTDLDALYAQQTQQKQDLEAKKTQYEGSEKTLQDQSDGLDQEIAELTRQEQAAAAQGAPERVVPDNGGSPGVGASGFMRPVPGTMNSTFGWRIHPIYHYRKFHAGNDFPIGCGTPVHVAQDGVVLANTSNAQAGNKVVVSHGVLNGKVITTSYHHLERYGASVGQHVSRGDVVGYVGTTGSSTGCHLHFEVQENGVPVDPAGYV